MATEVASKSLLPWKVLKRASSLCTHASVFLAYTLRNGSTWPCAYFTSVRIAVLLQTAALVCTPNPCRTVAIPCLSLKISTPEFILANLMVEKWRLVVLIFIHLMTRVNEHFLI